MTFVRQETLTINEARELEKQGFVVELVMMHLDGKDTYNIYVK